MIEICELVKQYGQRRAIDHLNLSIGDGEIFGLLGPNGAGKTTLIRILTMLTSYQEGSVLIQKEPIATDSIAIKALIGVVPQHFNLDSDLTAWENLELHGRLHHIPKEVRQKKIAELLAFVELDTRSDDMVQTFSGGMKRRLMIARALLHEPKILFLDEPTVGLDPQVRRKLWDLIRSLNQSGLTVLLTTHYIEEAEALCDRVAILEKGRLLVTDTPTELCRRVGQFALEWMEEGVLQARFFEERETAVAAMGQLSGTAALRKTNLEDVFVELTGRKVSE
ncbi:MAG: ABC transporter ATP-binding protein [Sporomusaceae bacterium]|nr:ABC transporter ATP-binding protein [Sporomusaceae bacterium]